MPTTLHISAIKFSGCILNRQLGSAIRLSAVTTDMPLVADNRNVFGADDYCINCQACRNDCPPDAIGANRIEY